MHFGFCPAHGSKQKRQKIQERQGFELSSSTSPARSILDSGFWCDTREAHGRGHLLGAAARPLDRLLAEAAQSSQPDSTRTPRRRAGCLRRRARPLVPKRAASAAPAPASIALVAAVAAIATLPVLAVASAIERATSSVRTRIVTSHSTEDTDITYIRNNN